MRDSLLEDVWRGSVSRRAIREGVRYATRLISRNVSARARARAVTLDEEIPKRLGTRREEVVERVSRWWGIYRYAI